MREIREAPARLQVVLLLLLPIIAATPILVPAIRDGDGGLIVRTVLLLGAVAVVVAWFGKQISAGITDRRLESELSHLAFHDSLTGLPNRALFQDRLKHALKRAERNGTPLSLLLIDLDDFKGVNDSLGVAAGDLFLVEVGERLSSKLRESDTCARLGADEFGVILERSDISEAEEAATRVSASMAAPIVLEGREAFAEASIGVSTWDQGMEEAELIKNADAAMQAVKAAGEGGFQVFEPRLHDSVKRRTTVKMELRDAIDRNELILHYQPIVNVNGGTITGLEALVRWQHPTRGLLGPFEFIGVAEQTGLMKPMGAWILETACRQAVEWRKAEGPPLHMSVNASARQLFSADFPETVSAILTEVGLRPEELILEITETALVADFERTIGHLEALKELGVKLAIDDFGTGYSSLSYLRRLPVDIVKIDRAFMSGITSASDEWNLALAIVKLTAALGLETVAEGIEDAGQLAHLRALRCDYAQGYYFARPQDADSIGSLMRATESEAISLPVAQARD